VDVARGAGAAALTQPTMSSNSPFFAPSTNAEISAGV
jgi:hypothetical protein